MKNVDCHLDFALLEQFIFVQLIYLYILIISIIFKLKEAGWLIIIIIII